MPVVAFQPGLPDGKTPSEMTFFDYGCCVSTSQTLWVLIFSFIFAILVVVACCMSSVFVRWVYKRRLRKKVEALKKKYRQEDREKREKQFQLDLIAKRPLVPQNRNLNKEKTAFINQYLTSQALQKDKTTIETYPTISTLPVTLSQTHLDPLHEMGKTTVLMNRKTVAGVVHELAKNDACMRKNQSPFPGVDIQLNSKFDEPFEKTKESTVTVEDATQQSSVEVVDPTKLMKDREQLSKNIVKGTPEILHIDKTQKNEDEKLRKRSAPVLSVSTDFPYYSGRLGSMKSLRYKKSSTASMLSYGTIQGNKTESVTSVTKESPPKTEANKMQYNVYELRRIAEEQAQTVETEEACELIRNRQPDRKDPLNNLETSALPKKMAQLQNVRDIGDSQQSVSYKDQK